MKDVKRLISTGFWNDDKVLNDFSPEDRYFMLYLLCNPYTTQLGVYHLPLKKAALELGYSLETVNTLIERFERKYKIIRFNYETSEVAIKNYLIHSIVRGGKPVADCLEKDLKGVKDLSLVGFVIEHISSIDKNNVNDTVIDFINKHNDIHNDNDNDNERYADESYHESLETAENQPKPRNSKKEKPIYYPNDELLNKAFYDYIDYRKKIKKPMTDRAIELAIEKLTELSKGDNDTAIKIINQSIMQGWQGLFELKQDSKSKQESFFDLMAKA